MANINRGPDLSLNTGSFEMERMLKENAHEKAFEIHVLAQRQFEQQKKQFVTDGKKQIKSDHDEKVNNLNLDLNIKKSKKINEARLLKMKERNKCLDEIKDIMMVKLKEEMENNRDRYLATVKNLILQSMIKLIEPQLEIMVREEDKDDIESMIPEIQDQYKEFMTEKTERDEYECELTILEEKYMPAELDKGCGGIILFTTNKRIMCTNTLVSRLNLACEESLPNIRATLFPSSLTEAEAK